MKERPIIFNAEMVRAIINGRKTQTRRVVKPQPIPYGEASPYTMATQREHIGKPWMPVGGVYQDRWPCPYGQLGDRLWLRETWGLMAHTDQTDWHRGSVAGESPDSIVQMFSVEHLANWRVENENAFWRPSIYMPRWASRITLEITGVRVERLQDISNDDCWAEGMSDATNPELKPNRRWFSKLWESINGPGSWDSNPFVWVIEFRKETKP